MSLIEDKCWAAFEKGDHKEAVHLLPLVKKPNKIRRENRWGNVTLLNFSSMNGWLDVTKDLITKYHFDPHKRDGLGCTCLHWAADSNQVDVLRYLIDECHCNPKVPGEYGDTVLHSVAANAGSLDFMKYLISHHQCDPMATTNWGMTVLHRAAEHIDIVKYLINECHCDPKATTKDGMTVLHCAAGHIDSEVIQVTEKFNTTLAAVKLHLDITYLVTIIEELTILNQMDCTKWFQFGLHLGLYDPRLKAIETDYRGKTVECFCEFSSYVVIGIDLV
ncbi:PREDICTED: espin-like [Amphimedon queenslandica]|uniref:Uncharacterized protein n=1 Tax=Amphimedon queenslandica TaxID=400682 RepID=A0AAN0IK38_AMPQE|nr:PREDICTED: espin-like [Amphimedon queenslandica]|eukprot:XP_011402533.1 PREDICTED: espin-like [Amphimedon queenslandica]